MKRCSRHLNVPSDPYEEFDFEKSLRKYEIVPHKKIKLRSFIDSPNQSPQPLAPISLNGENKEEVCKEEVDKQEEVDVNGKQFGTIDEEIRDQNESRNAK